jgi:hypothetical protein
MVSVVCWNCEAERELWPGDEVEPFCDGSCKAEFHEVVDRLIAGDSYEAIGIAADLAELSR